MEIENTRVFKFDQARLSSSSGKWKTVSCFCFALWIEGAVTSVREYTKLRIVCEVALYNFFRSVTKRMHQNRLNFSYCVEIFYDLQIFQ